MIACFGERTLHDGGTTSHDRQPGYDCTRGVFEQLHNVSEKENERESMHEYLILIYDPLGLRMGLFSRLPEGLH